MSRCRVSGSGRWDRNRDADPRRRRTSRLGEWPDAAHRFHAHHAAAPKARRLEVAVTVVVRDGAGRLLLIRAVDTDHYSIPGGIHEVGETIFEAAVRDVAERTGVVVKVTGLVGVYSDPRHAITVGKGEIRQEFSVCFRATPTSGEPAESVESAAAVWVDPADLRHLTIHPSVRLRIAHGLTDRAEPFFT
ncbi:MAG TPA: NUDIX domain-containing protein [Jiangellaceae bacterium]